MVNAEYFLSIPKTTKHNYMELLTNRPSLHYAQFTVKSDLQNVYSRTSIIRPF